MLNRDRKISKFLSYVLRLRPGSIRLTLDAQGWVGARCGEPNILEVAVGEMTRTGKLFYLSANGVWLTDNVPPANLKYPDRE